MHLLKRYNLIIVVKNLFLIIMAIIMVVPFLWMISASFKVPSQIFEFPIKWIPDPISFDGYKYVWQRPIIGVTFGKFYLNSIKVALIVLVGTFFSCSLAAYGYTKIHFKGRDAIFLLKIATMMIPFQVIMVPTFIVYRNLGLVDTHAALWLIAFLGTPFGTFLLRQFFLTIPDELCESTRIDGAGHFRIYWHIILPLSKPALVTLLILTFVVTWNDYETPLLYLRSPNLFTIPLGLRAMASDIEYSNEAGNMAGAVSAVVPILIVFIAAQKYFIKGIAFTGIKS
ncbi:MAG TPA: carbohydrate ABC transporter permease [Clostridiaceae bacterium]|nr:carbohydrate ABC transporter permease [Clostridiaceae bacterium]